MKGGRVRGKGERGGRERVKTEGGRERKQGEREGRKGIVEREGREGVGKNGEGREVEGKEGDSGRGRVRGIEERVKVNDERGREDGGIERAKTGGREGRKDIGVEGGRGGVEGGGWRALNEEIIIAVSVTILHIACIAAKPFENVYEDYLPQDPPPGVTQPPPTQHPNSENTATAAAAARPYRSAASKPAKTTSATPERPSSAATAVSTSEPSLTKYGSGNVATPNKEEDFPSADLYGKPHPPPPQDVLSGGYGQLNDHSSTTTTSSKKTPVNELDFTGLGLSFAPAMENSFGLSLGVAPTSSTYAAFPAENSYQQPEGNSSQVMAGQAQNEKSWSRVVGRRQGAEIGDTPFREQRAELKFTEVSSHNSSFGYGEDDADDMDKHFRPSEAFVHQSQVENDTFQPYDRETPLLLTPRGGGANTGGISKAREIAAVQGKGWTKEEDRDVGKKASVTDSRSRNGVVSVMGPGRGGEVSPDISNSNSLSGLGSASHSPWFPVAGVTNTTTRAGAGRTDRDAKVKDAFMSIGETINTSEHSAYGLGLNMSAGIATTWGTGETTINPPGPVMSVMATPTFPPNNPTHHSEDVRPSPGEENALLGGYQAVGNAFSTSTDSDMLMFGDYSHGSSNDISDVVMDGEFVCLLCYKGFKSEEELGHHCSTNSHMEAAMLDSGAERVWQFAPPPSRKVNLSSLQMCGK